MRRFYWTNDTQINMMSCVSFQSNENDTKCNFFYIYNRSESDWLICMSPNYLRFDEEASVSLHHDVMGAQRLGVSSNYTATTQLTAQCNWRITSEAPNRSHHRDILEAAVEVYREVSLRLEVVGLRTPTSRFHGVVLHQIFSSPSAIVRPPKGGWEWGDLLLLTSA